MSKGNELVDLTAVRKAETDKAWLLDFGDEALWIPKSQCEVEPNRDGKTVTVTMEQWKAEEKGLV
jgi:hypothetical protein